MVSCFLSEDYDGALSVLTEMTYLAQERGGITQIIIDLDFFFMPAS